MGIQALFQIMEPTVSIRCRQADLEMVENVLPEAMSLYNDAMKKPCQITVLKDNFLPANACGGVELAAFHGRIRQQYSGKPFGNDRWSDVARNTKWTLRTKHEPSNSLIDQLISEGSNAWIFETAVYIIRRIYSFC